jgi:hypothetical protein
MLLGVTNMALQRSGPAGLLHWHLMVTDISIEEGLHCFNSSLLSQQCRHDQPPNHNRQLPSVVTQVSGLQQF